MSKTIRMSAEEKQQQLLTLFHLTKDVFNKDELEKQGSSIGIKMDTVMDNVKILMDDKLVQSDKIGSGNFYWAFPSSELVKQQNVTAQAQRAIDADEAAIAQLEAREAALKAASTDAGAVASALAEIDTLKREVEVLSKQAQSLSDCDPAVFEAIKAAAKTAKAGADRWTDNVLACRAWILKKMAGRTPAEIDKMLGIPADFDFVA